MHSSMTLGWTFGRGRAVGQPNASGLCNQADRAYLFRPRTSISCLNGGAAKGPDAVAEGCPRQIRLS